MIKVIRKFSVSVNKDAILKMIGCNANQDMYNEYSEEYDAIIESALKLIRPAAVLCVHTKLERVELKDKTIQSKMLSVILTVGELISEQSSRKFLNNKYIAGLLYSSIADYYLFQMDGSLKEDIISLCKLHNLSIVRRLEAPESLSLSMHKRMIQKTEADKRIQVEVLESGMFNPVKSMGIAYLLEEGLGEYHTEHDCSLCKKLDCSYRDRKEKG